VDAGVTNGPLFMNKVADATQQIATQRMLPPTHIVMHPRRWAWIMNASDSTGRPLVEPQGAGPGMNALGSSAGPAAQGVAGTLAGLTVIVDANIPTNLGAGTNQDTVIVTRAADNYLFENASVPVLRVYEEVLSGNLAVRLQAYGYYAFSSERLPKANADISGTGLTPPAFPS
jgi:HK97 family phage major capsid protein